MMKFDDKHNHEVYVDDISSFSIVGTISRWVDNFPSQSPDIIIDMFQIKFYILISQMTTIQNQNLLF